MEELLFLCGLVIIFTVCVMGKPEQQSKTKPHAVIEDDRYLKLLSRVENLEARDRAQQAEIHEFEARDREQQAEIHELRSELNAEKRITQRLEATLSWFMLNIGTHNNHNTKTADADGFPKQDENIFNAKENVRDTRSKISAGDQTSRIRRQEGVPVIAFQATLTNHQQHTGVHQSIVFDNVITNIGAAYNPHLGSFIAPVPGVYVFSTTILGYGSTDVHCIIAKNGGLVVNMLMRATGATYDSDSATVVLHLNKGDDVEVQGNDPDRFIHGGHYSMFSGFLLHEDQPTESIVG